MSKDIVDFVTYCIGNLARRLNLSADEVYRMLKDSGILSEYIVPSYDVLHTFQGVSHGRSHRVYAGERSIDLYETTS